jgi:hypothetical protein
MAFNPKTKKMNKVLISLFDYTGNASRPYKENGWDVIQVDIQHGRDILTWDYVKWYISKEYYSTMPEVGIIAMVPCTDYALSGAKHFYCKDTDGTTELSQKLVARTKKIIDFFDDERVLRFWQIENPMSRIHKLNPWMGNPRLKFNPCDYAGYDPAPEDSRYNKMTWLWGKFNIPRKKYIEPISKDNPGWKQYGGKSLKTKNARSVTPLGFAYAFYEANK